MLHKRSSLVDLLLSAFVNDWSRRCNQRLNSLKGDQAHQSDGNEPEQLGQEVPGLIELYRRQQQGFDVAMVAKGG